MKTSRIFLYTISLIVVLFYLVMTVSAPVRKLNRINLLASSDSIFMSQNSAIATYKGLLPLVKESAYKEAQIILAKQDSIGLVINFKDSIASLMLKGVEIHASKIISYKRDKLFNGIKAPAVKKIFSSPLHNISEFSTVVKEPIVKKRAPKDPAEALQMATVPDTIAAEPAYVVYNMELGFRLILVQEKWETQAEKKVERKFKSDIRKQRLKDMFYSLIHLKEPVYTPTVIIELNANEVRSIYRAMPWKASVVMLL